MQLILSSERSRSNEEDLRFVRDVLDARPDKNGELSVAFGLLPHEPNEIAILSRSMVEILLEVASGIEVPGEDVARGLTHGPVRARSHCRGPARPSLDPHLVVSITACENVLCRATSWYWIDDGDIASKRVFTFLMLFFSLAETGVTPQAPVLTVPAN